MDPAGRGGEHLAIVGWVDLPLTPVSRRTSAPSTPTTNDSEPAALGMEPAWTLRP
jgi:hypothetical protein